MKIYKYSEYVSLNNNNNNKKSPEIWYVDSRNFLHIWLNCINNENTLIPSVRNIRIINFLCYIQSKYEVKSLDLKSSLIKVKAIIIIQMTKLRKMTVVSIREQ